MGNEKNQPQPSHLDRCGDKECGHTRSLHLYKKPLANTVCIGKLCTCRCQEFVETASAKKAA
jgi:hypothetical protein